MPADLPDVFVGIDTHADTHHVAVVNQLGRHLADRQFPADPGGYRRLLDWISSIGSVAGVGVEGTGTYGAQLGPVLTAAGLAVVEVNRPDRATRRANGESDPVDAYAAAQAVVTRRHRGVHTLSSRCSAIGSQGKDSVHQPDSRAADHWPDGLT
jgi:transposase